MPNYYVYHSYHMAKHISYKCLLSSKVPIDIEQLLEAFKESRAKILHILDSSIFIEIVIIKIVEFLLVEPETNRLSV